jgi:hypothetical protein
VAAREDFWNFEINEKKRVIRPKNRRDPKEH